jgi:hypothetical protein
VPCTNETSRARTAPQCPHRALPQDHQHGNVRPLSGYPLHSPYNIRSHQLNMHAQLLILWLSNCMPAISNTVSHQQPTTLVHEPNAITAAHGEPSHHCSSPQPCTPPGVQQHHWQSQQGCSMTCKYSQMQLCTHPHCASWGWHTTTA